MGWPSLQLSTTQLPTHSPPGAMRKRTKVRTLVGRDKDSLISEWKRDSEKKKSDANAITHFPLPDQCPASLQAMATTSSKSPFPQFLLLSTALRHYRECNRPLVNLGQLCPLPTSCSPSAYLLGRQSWEKRQPGQHASTAQQQLKLGCVFTVLEQPNHSIICGCAYVAVLPDRSGTVFQ